MHNCGTFAFRDVLAEVYRGWLFLAQVPTDNSFKHFQDWEIQFVAYSDACVVCSVSSLGWFSSLQPTRQNYEYLSISIEEMTGRLQEAVHSIQSPPETSYNSLSLCQQQSATPRFGPVFDMLFVGFVGTVDIRYWMILKCIRYVFRIFHVTLSLWICILGFYTWNICNTFTFLRVFHSTVKDRLYSWLNAREWGKHAGQKVLWIQFTCLTIDVLQFLRSRPLRQPDGGNIKQPSC